MLRAQPARVVGGVELGSHEPVFDIVVSAEKKQGFTSPPKAFTEDTLLSAMESAGNKK